MPFPGERAGKSAVGAVPAWSSPGSESSSGRHSSGTPARWYERSRQFICFLRSFEMFLERQTYLRGIDPVQLGRVGEVADKVQGVDVDPLEVARLGTAQTGGEISQIRTPFFEFGFRRGEKTHSLTTTQSPLPVPSRPRLRLVSHPSPMSFPRPGKIKLPPLPKCWSLSPVTVPPLRT